MRAIIISEVYIEKELAEALKQRKRMQKADFHLNAQYYSGKLVVLRQLMDLPKGEIG